MYETTYEANKKSKRKALKNTDELNYYQMKSPF